MSPLVLRLELQEVGWFGEEKRVKLLFRKNGITATFALVPLGEPIMEWTRATAANLYRDFELTIAPVSTPQEGPEVKG